nr:DUF4256 domain-containing protein [Salinicoccus luteus]
MQEDQRLSDEEKQQLLSVLKTRFESHMHRHERLDWKDVEARLDSHPGKLWSLGEMERTGGEPDAAGEADGLIVYYDFSEESPKGRRKVCYDDEALQARKKNKPEHSAVGMAEEMGVELLDEAHYRQLQTIETVDRKTSSWIRTPADIRGQGGALFGDYRYGAMFIYHNGADSYYSARGFRAVLHV